MDIAGIYRSVYLPLLPVPIRIDQLCIPQDDETIRRTLARVPTIYRTFDVVIMMPGRPCKCLRDFLEKSKAADALEESGQRGQLTSVPKRIAKHDHCLNFTAPSSWIFGLWTRQELMYSQSIRCVWAVKTTPQCVPQIYQNEIW
jgi:hypothetical protein